MPIDDEILAGFPNNEAPISLHTRRVAELLRSPGAADRWRDQCHESYQAHRQRIERHKAWEARRQEYASANFRGRTEGDSTPPGEGWTWGAVRWFSADGTQTWHAMGWFPPDLNDDSEPFAGGVLQFSHRYKPSLADCYFALAAVHDADRDGPGTLMPFADDDIAARCTYEVNLRLAAELSECDRLTLDDCLARVEADLRAQTVVAETPGQICSNADDVAAGSESIAGAKAPPRFAQNKKVANDVKHILHIAELFPYVTTPAGLCGQWSEVFKILSGPVEVASAIVSNPDIDSQPLESLRKWRDAFNGIEARADKLLSYLHGRATRTWHAGHAIRKAISPISSLLAVSVSALTYLPQLVQASAVEKIAAAYRAKLAEWPECDPRPQLVELAAAVVCESVVKIDLAEAFKETDADSQMARTEPAANAGAESAPVEPPHEAELQVPLETSRFSEDDWITLAEAAMFSGLSEGAISRAATRGEIKDNDKTRKGRRLHAGSLMRWLKVRVKERESDEHVTKQVDKHVKN